MAKGKRAAALFEVIQASREREHLRTTGGGFMTPSWWFKSKKSNGTPAAASNPPPPPRAEAPAPSKNVLPAAPAPIKPEEDEAETSAPVEVMRIASPEAEAEEHHDTTDDSLSGTFTPEPSPPPVHHEFVDNEEPALEDPKPSPVIKPAPRARKLADSSGGRKPVDVAVDRGHQQIVLRLSFTSAAISTFAVIVVVALIVLVTKSYSKGPNSADAASIANVKNGKAYPSVMSVFQGKGEEPPINVAPAPKPAPQQKPTQQTQTKTPGKLAELPKETPQPPALKPPQPQQQAMGLNSAGRRIIGEQYVLIQSYPDPEDANDARDALNKAGIQCTVEKGTRWAPTWSCVIGTRGFDHTKNNPEFATYMKSIQEVSNTFAGASKFRRFEPQVIGWKE
jgi:hypothetical protein